MKKILLVALSFAAAVSASAQLTYLDSGNKDIYRHSMRYGRGARTEIVLPQVNGYNVYKADLHTHSAFSDGSVLPEYRVKEAWADGLDIMAVTEHIEYRRQETKMLEYLEDYAKKGETIDNWDIINNPADKKGIKTSTMRSSFRRRLPSSMVFLLFLVLRSPVILSRSVTTMPSSQQTTMQSMIRILFSLSAMQRLRVL